MVSLFCADVQKTASTTEQYDTQLMILYSLLAVSVVIIVGLTVAVLHVKGKLSCTTGDSIYHCMFLCTYVVNFIPTFFLLYVYTLV